MGYRGLICMTSIMTQASPNLAGRTFYPEHPLKRQQSLLRTFGMYEPPVTAF